MTIIRYQNLVKKLAIGFIQFSHFFLCCHIFLVYRYNISTAEFNGWDGSTNASLNEPKRGEGRNQGSLLDLSERYGLEDLDEARERGYVLENNPQVNIFDNDKLELQLAINTAQFGRTFQDRCGFLTQSENY